jgi:hypothetical protein
MKRDEAVYLGKLQRLGCTVCRLIDETYEAPDPSQQKTVIHHVREGQGGAQRAQNWLAIPLCVAHHTGTYGIHANGNRIPYLKMDEMDLLAKTLEIFFKTYGI